MKRRSRRRGMMRRRGKRRRRGVKSWRGKRRWRRGGGGMEREGGGEVGR